MNRMFFEQWKQKRISKIIDIFGADWFAFKNVLELAACYGDIGIELIKLGANVTFTEGRDKNIRVIKDKLISFGIAPVVHKIDQNSPYSINGKFDLVLHLGVLYHIEDWKRDIECALQHSNTMVLETIVNTNVNEKEKLLPVILDEDYEGLSTHCSLVTQEAIEEHLSFLGCKFIRFDTQQLNTTWSGAGATQIRNVYDWKYRTVESYKNPFVRDSQVHYRRMWLILK